MSTEESREEPPPIAPIASWWRRGLADIIDFALEALVVVVCLITGLRWGVLPLWVAYCAAAVYYCPPSPGKRKLGLHVVRSDGSPCTMGELLKHKLLQLPAVVALLLKGAPLWKMSSMFDGRWRRTARDHLESTLLVYCPELSGKVREPDPGRAAREEKRTRTRVRFVPPGQGALFDGEGPGGLEARSGTVHRRNSEGDPLCGVENKAMTLTYERITCRRCQRCYRGPSKSKKGS